MCTNVLWCAQVVLVFLFFFPLLSVVWEDCPGLGHEPGIQCRFLCLLSNSYIVCWVSSCLEIQSGGLSTHFFVVGFFFFLCSSYLPYISEEDNAVDIWLLSSPLVSHKGSSQCQLELRARVDLKLVKKKKFKGLKCSATWVWVAVRQQLITAVCVTISLPFFTSDGELHVCAVQLGSSFWRRK